MLRLDRVVSMGEDVHFGQGYVGWVRILRLSWVVSMGEDVHFGLGYIEW
jgi:hypothetical protein